MRKYGGTSLATPGRIRDAAADLAACARAGARVVVVVSAMGDTTDRLVALARGFADRPDPRELDQVLATGEQVSAALMALALRQHGVAAVSLSGGQAGIETDGEPGAARVVRVDPEPVLGRLAAGQVVVVAGFQGRDAAGELRTLGRGGSDTTAVALAAALGATGCEICTDVPGVHTADPRIVPDSRPVPSIRADVMAELARGGAAVLHPRSVELAGRHGVTVRVTHASRTGPATTVRPGAPALERGTEVVGIAHARDVHLVRVAEPGLGLRGGPRLLADLAGSGLRPDTLSWPERGELRFTVRGAEPLDRLEALGVRCTVDSGFGAVSVVGTGLLDAPGPVAHVLRLAGELGVTVPAMATSAGRLTAVFPGGLLEAAVRALHRSFGLDRPGEDRP
ncbi:aspartate kinase [Amycolatopsis australiensis]|uniref:aspartate kinase n=1 Tax=Amycolatopsis australiensis TaxID=546364 RepID=UPI001FEBFEA3|nr:aspartate kinase [Amycolatopsis australiensis]